MFPILPNSFWRFALKMLTYEKLSLPGRLVAWAIAIYLIVSFIAWLAVLVTAAIRFIAN